MAKTPLQAALTGKRNGPTVQLFLADPHSTPVTDLKKTIGMSEPPTLAKSILRVLNGEDGSVERLAFERDPSANAYTGVYLSKMRLIPDHILKRIAIQDDLVSSIVTTRSAQVSAFGRPRPDRFSTGFEIVAKPGVLNGATEEQKKALQTRIKRAAERFYTCGDTEGVEEHDRLTMQQFLWQTSRNAVVVGRIAVEAVYVLDPATGQNRFHRFRPIDAGTIYRAAPQKRALETLRHEAKTLLESLKNEKFKPERFENDEYTWVQVVEGKPVQAFTSKECFVHSFYPVLDIELEGYPVTPLDTIISQVTMHVNIVTHNKLYFASGRASRGMIVIQSEDVDETVVSHVRQQFNAAINGASASWRMPVFGVGANDKLTWEPIDTGGRDMEFQYLSDQNARSILSAFQMSPEELPGFQHLSRGTNSQSLSESNQEYKLEAARDTGIRPLLGQFQDFLNERIFPLVDPDLSKLAEIRLSGLDAETAEKESVRLQQDAPVHMNYDEILEKVEKDPLGKEWGGTYPFNPQLQAIHDKFFPVGRLLEEFFGVEGASKDLHWAYVRDPFWFQWQQLLMQQEAMKMQQQQQMQQQQAPQQGQSPPPEGGGGAPPQPQGSPPAPPSQSAGEESDLSRSIDQTMALLTKGEKQLPPSKRQLLVRQKRLVTKVMDEWEKDSKKTLDDILAIVEHHSPPKA